MYIAFTTPVYFHESVPPDNTDLLWILTNQVNRLVPTCSTHVSSSTPVIDVSKQLLEIYEFETLPEIRAYSQSSKQWETTTEGYKLISRDSYVLIDATGRYLITRRKKE